MKFVNLTPHEIKIFSDEQKAIVILPSGHEARVSVTSTLEKEIDDIKVYKTTYGNIEGLPEPRLKTIYIVSSIVASRVKDRSDVMVPFGFVRNDKGVIVGCRGLQKI